jgi:hypothetical protein
MQYPLAAAILLLLALVLYRFKGVKNGIWEY